eukprot:763364-Hanusia_phi.AAC.1
MCDQRETVSSGTDEPFKHKIITPLLCGRNTTQLGSLPSAFGGNRCQKQSEAERVGGVGGGAVGRIPGLSGTTYSPRDLITRVLHLAANHGFSQCALPRHFGRSTTETCQRSIVVAR